ARLDHLLERRVDLIQALADLVHVGQRLADDPVIQIRGAPQGAAQENQAQQPAGPSQTLAHPYLLGTKRLPRLPVPRAPRGGAGVGLLWPRGPAAAGRRAGAGSNRWLQYTRRPPAGRCETRRAAGPAHKTPLVDGTPGMRGSGSTAWRRARA